MLTRVASFRQWLQRRWLYSLISVLTIGSIAIAQPQISQAAPWWQILIQGAQYVQLASLSDSQEIGLGAKINEQLTSGQVRLYNNPSAIAYVDGIGQRLARNSARPNIRYTFQVVQDDGINAFATMGGFVYVNTGLLKAADNEAQLAGVMGHEIGHIAGRHALQQMKQAALTQGLSSLAGVDTNQLAQIGVQVALTLPNSRKDEYDADERGLATLIKAGYAPTGLPEFLKKLVRANSSPEFLSSHPGANDRVTRLEKAIPTAYRSRTEGLNASTYKQQIQRFF
jgi:beta-barrel assembly-enhancing protease